jgi:transcriptional regulator with XRE-family HTH domain
MGIQDDVERRLRTARDTELYLTQEINRKLERINQILDQQLKEITRETSGPVAPHLAALHWIKRVTGFGDSRIGEMLGVTRQTLNRWERGESITSRNRQRLFAVRDVLERATLQFTTVPALSAWLDTPRGADGRTPAQLLTANEIDRARLLAVTTPAPHVVPQPERLVAAAFHTSMEQPEETLLPVLDEPVPGEDDEPDVFLPVKLVE